MGAEWFLYREHQLIKQSLSEIILNWPGINSFKSIRVISGNDVFSFLLYNSEMHTRQVKDYINLPVILDRYQLVLIRNDSFIKTNEDTVPWRSKSVAKRLNKVKKVSKRELSYTKNWVTLDELNLMMLEIDEIMEHIEEIKIIDILTS